MSYFREFPMVVFVNLFVLGGVCVCVCVGGGGGLSWPFLGPKNFLCFAP